MRTFINPRGASQRPYEMMQAERIRAHDKHDAGGASMERKDWDNPAWLPVLVEEVGEVARVLCEIRHGTYDGPIPAWEDLRDELVQVGAMTAAWLQAVLEVLETHQPVAKVSSHVPMTTESAGDVVAPKLWPGRGMAG